MNWLKFFSDYTFLIHKLPQKGNLPQVKKHCFRVLVVNTYTVWSIFREKSIEPGVSSNVLYSYRS